MKATRIIVLMWLAWAVIVISFQSLIAARLVHELLLFFTRTLTVTSPDVPEPITFTAIRSE